MRRQSSRTRPRGLVGKTLVAAALGLALTAPATAEEAAPRAGLKLGAGVAAPAAPGLRVVTQPVVVATPTRTAPTADQPLICTAVYGTAICKCTKKCVATRSDCRCED